ncbi:MAG TPA: polysaccharide biosynthesis tyrosine autokinase [Ignavibacteriales bacterium]|nr:polysaccharide biosynthesis tyrosine autokinase [Ignavibacteriales bacterium]
MNNHQKSQSEEPMRMTHLLEIIYRQKWTIIATFLTVISFALILTLLQKKVYEANTSIIVDESPANMALGLGNPDSKTDKVQIQAEVLQSRDLMSHVAEKLLDRVYLDPNHPNDTLLIIRDARKLQNVTDLSSPRMLEGVIKQLRNSMELMTKKGMNVIKLSFRSHSPEEAALIANLFIDTYYDRDLNRIRSNSSELRAFLEKQSAIKARDLARSDSALQSYMQTNNVTALDLESNIANNKVAQLQSDLESADIEYQKNRLLLESYKKELARLSPQVAQKIVSGDDLYIKELQQEIARKEAQLDISKVVSSAEAQRPEYKSQLNKTSRAIDSLRSILNARTKDYVKSSMSNYSITGGASGTDQGNIISELSGQIQQLQVKQNTLELNRKMLSENLGKYKGRLSQLPKESITLAKLQRDRAFNEKVAEDLKAKYQEAMLAERSTFGEIQLLDKASVPLEPVSPNARFNLIIGAISGLSLGFILAFIFNFANNKIYTPKDIEYLGFRLLSTIPKLQLEPKTSPRLLKEHSGAGGGKHPSTSLVTAKNPNSEIYESYLRLGINLAYSLMERRFKSLLITSAGPGAGKSATAINVSVTLANLGKSVLLIDTDIRRPVVHKYFSKSMTPGLTDYLLEQRQIEDIIQPTLVKGLDVITCGGKLLNPSLILSSAKMRYLVEEDTSRYDFIVYDAPPLNPVTDAIHLAKLVDEVILVARAEKTQAEELKRANELLQQVNVAVSGVVLNDFDTSKAPFSGKHYGYYAYNEDVPKKRRFGGRN